MSKNWYTTTKTDDSQGLVCDENTGANIAVTYDPQDAPLVAAAPELLEALENLERVASYTFHNNPQLAEAIVNARATIAKAKGE